MTPDYTGVPPVIWETKEDMDAFYDPDNKTFSNFVETAKTLFEQMRNGDRESSIENLNLSYLCS